MGENSRKRFVVLFCLLLLLQDTHGFLKNRQSDEKWEGRNVKSRYEQIETKATSAVNSRRERGTYKYTLRFRQFKHYTFERCAKKLIKPTLSYKGVLRRLNGCNISLVCDIQFSFVITFKLCFLF